VWGMTHSCVQRYSFIYVNMCTCIYIFIYTHLYLSIDQRHSLSVYASGVFLHRYVCACIYIGKCVHIYIYTHTLLYLSIDQRHSLSVYTSGVFLQSLIRNKIINVQVRIAVCCSVLQCVAVWSVSAVAHS